MKTKLISVGRALLGFILALLGFSGCEDPDPTIGPDAYGPLYADYLCQGTVIDAQTIYPVSCTEPSPDKMEISFQDEAELTPNVE